LRQQLIRHSPFVALMAGGAGLGIVRLLTLAIILSAGDYGIYSIVVAATMFLSSMPGLGLIEDTRKKFPRLYADGHAADIVPQADYVTRLVGFRTAISGGAAIVITLLLGAYTWAIMIAASTALAFGIAWSSILASALRAGASPFPLALTSFIRAVITLIVTIGASFEFGLTGALCGEAIGAVIGGIAMRMALQKIHSSPRKRSNLDQPSQASRAGMLVFLGILFVNAPTYLNRPVAALSMSPAEVGTLSLLLVLVGVLQTTIGIFDQITGPRLIHWQHSGVALEIQKRRFFVLIGALTLFCAGTFGLIWGVVSLPWIAPLVEKYTLSAGMMVPATVLAALSITTSADWMLQAHDREQIITTAAVANLAIFGLLTLLVALGNIGILVYLWGLAAAKLCQLIIQLTVIARLPSPEEAH